MNNKYTRQVHLDFHTSPLVENVGGNFDRRQFQETLKKGNVQSITVFAKCHHSMCYYPTEVGIRHPNLQGDLLGNMIDAAHEIGVRAPIYITAGWSEADFLAHPEWACKNKDGSNKTCNFDETKALSDKKPDDSWHFLCLADGSYCQHIYDITEEICKKYKNVDGLFYDICAWVIGGGACYCDECKKGMKAMGLDVENEADAKHYFSIKRQAFMKKCYDILVKYHPDGTIFFNSGGATIDKPQYHPYQTHYEMEDLPTAWGGYDKLPFQAKCMSKYGKPCIGMTGKFHLSWGEFGGYKPKEALKYEVASMALYGVGCSIGDHMHPDGVLEDYTYQNIGYAFDYQEKIAPYVFGGKPYNNIGVYFASFESANGISKILLENHIDYSVIYNGNFSDFDTVIIPDDITLPDDELLKFKAFLDNGGKAVLCSKALLKDGKFQLDFGVEYIGDAPFDCDYLEYNEASRYDLPTAPMLCYFPAVSVKAKEGATVLAEVSYPYFTRTYEHYCGHKNAPNDKSGKKVPAIIKHKNVVYLAHKLPTLYDEYGSIFFKNYFLTALEKVYDNRLIKTENFLSQGRITAIEQEDKNRFCINLTYASPIKRGKAEIIDDIIPIYDIKITLKTEKQIKKVYLPLKNQALDFNYQNGEATFTLPKLHLHESIVLEY